MRYRRLDAQGDRVFGGSGNDFYVDQPEVVAQAVTTRLRLFLGEWGLDTTDGTPWMTKVFGKYTEGTRNMTLRGRILASPGVLSIDSFVAQYDPQVRRYAVTSTITTIYGQSAINNNAPVNVL